MWNVYCYLALIGLSVGAISGAKILAVFPFPGPSQYILVQPYLKALAGRGHEMTVISAFPQKTPVPNFRDIQIETMLYSDEDNVLDFFLHDYSAWGELDFIDEFVKGGTINMLESDTVRSLLTDPGEHFDLIIVEALGLDVIYAWGDHFKAPVIGISSFGTDLHCDSLMGNASPLSYIPLITSTFSDRMSFGERLTNVYQNAVGLVYDHLVHRPGQEAIWRKYMPNAEGDFAVISRNISLMLLNQHPALSFPRPYVPTMREVGGFHVSHTPNPLPQDVADFTARYPQGVVYFSLGSNIKSVYLSDQTIATLMQFFAELPLGVLWKFEKDTLPNKPANVFIKEWFPQPDILAHPQVLAFFTHGGLLSTIESLYHATPMVAMPFFYDQHMNSRRAEKFGFCTVVDFRSLTIDMLRSAFDRVLNDPRYRTKASEVSRIFRDTQNTPLDTAIYWTEFVLRHRGTPYMRVAALDLNFIQYNCIDIFAVIFGVLAAVVWIAVLFTRKLFSLFCALTTAKGPTPRAMSKKMK